MYIGLHVKYLPFLSHFYQIWIFSTDFRKILVCQISGKYVQWGGLGSSVDIAIELRAGRSGIEFRWGRDFPPVHTGHGAHPASCKMGTGSFPGGRGGRGVGLTPHRHLVCRGPRKSRAIPLLTQRAFVACKKGGTSSGSRNVPCGRTDRQTWRSQQSLFEILRTRLKDH